MDFMPLRLNSSSLTCSICGLAAIILQLVAMECQKLDIVVCLYSLHDFRIFIPFEEKSSDHFKDLHKLKFLTNFDDIFTSFLGGVIN